METGVPAKGRWQIGFTGDRRICITSDARGVQCWEIQDDGRWQATRGSYRKVGHDRVRHGRWIWYRDDGTVDLVCDPGMEIPLELENKTLSLTELLDALQYKRTWAEKTPEAA